MSQPAGDLVIDLSLEADARKTASTVEQGLSRQALA
ncbi:phage tail tape measure protein, partial [Escherichia coli]|nr:phage tail tape measure protein [Escherichia coli]EER8803749.1 phage tail tape measure protein [Escherichia coli]EEX0694338.1 phage tail tape measure protein [Escherichia coli]EHC4798256.1 phage tail tape measure protein [Escherichia coli]EHC4807441.1 phage tail tape measure protein [Escherichia coli]